MIGKVAEQCAKPHDLLRYLFGPGRDNEHVNPRVVASWCGDTAHLQPEAGEDGQPDVTELAELLSDPLDLVRGNVPDKPVYHLIIRAADVDRSLTDAEWQDISIEVMHRLGLSERGNEENGCRWVAVHHGDNHVHLAVTLARMDGKPARLRGDWFTIGQTMTWAEKKYGLKVVPRGRDRRSSAVSPTRDEFHKTARRKHAQPVRAELRGLIAAAAAVSFSEQAFFAGLEAKGLQVQLRYSTVNPGKVTGYSVGLPGDVKADGRPVMYGGSKLDRNLSLPRLRARWTSGISLGHRTTRVTATAVLRHEVTAAAAESVTEEAFFRNLAARGIDMHLWHDPARPGRVVRYSAGLPGKARKDGTPIRYAAGTLSPALTLGKLRAHWREGQPGAAAPGLYDGIDRDTIYAHAASVATWAASEIQKNPRYRADVALAAADVANAAADATGNQALRGVADAYLESARAGRQRAGHRSLAGQALRVAARLLQATAPPGTRDREATRHLLIALIGLADAVDRLKQVREQGASRATAAAIRGSVPHRARR